MTNPFKNQGNPLILRIPVQAIITILLPTLLFALEAYPPIVPEGETIPNAEALIRSISRQRVVLSVAFSPDGKTLASGSYNNTIRLWDVETSKGQTRSTRHSTNFLSANEHPAKRTRVCCLYEPGGLEAAGGLPEKFFDNIHSLSYHK